MPSFISFRSSQFWLLLLMLGMSGCLPTACQRQESRALLPQDSLARHQAELTPIDTLRQVWQSTGTLDHPLQYPRTVYFGEHKVFVSDAESNKIHEFEDSGIWNTEYSSPYFSFPYLSGVSGDTLLVFNPEDQRIDFMLDGRSVWQVPTPTNDDENYQLQYTLIKDGQIFYKALAEEEGGFIARLNRSGDILEQVELLGPTWRHAGLLRLWGDSLISLCAFRPVADVWTEGRLDTLALSGFDSPMLPRSRQFLLGDTHEPPLLTPSSAIAGNHLYALNIRPGWLRIDEFDRAGKLTRRLVQDNPEFNKSFYPIDLDVRITSDNTLEFAVLFVKPAPMLALYEFPLPEYNNAEKDATANEGTD